MATPKQMNDRVREWITSELDRTGKSKKELAAALKLAPSGVTRLLQGQREISTEELVRLSHFFGNPETFLDLLMEFHPGYRLERRPDWDPTTKRDVEDEVAQVRRAMSSALKQVSEMPGVWVVATSPGDETCDLFIEDRIVTRVPIPIGFQPSSAMLCILVTGDFLSPKFEDGDPIFMVPPGDYDEAKPLVICEWINVKEDKRRPITLGLLVGGDAETGHLTLEHPGTGSRHQIDPKKGIRGIYRAATLQELFGL